MPLERRAPIFPNPIRRYILGAGFAVVAAAAVLIAWRGPAILLDLGGTILAMCF